MSLIVAGALAGAALLGGLLALQRGTGRRGSGRQGAATTPGADSTTPKPKPALSASRPPNPELAVQLGDVVQVGEQSRWLQSALLVQQAQELEAVVYFSERDDQAVVALPAPKHHLLWLEAEALALPATPPSRLEIGGVLLDRSYLCSAVVTRQIAAGETSDALTTLAPAISGSVQFAIYDGPGSRCAALLQSSAQHFCWSGQRLEPDEYDRLGQG